MKNFFIKFAGTAALIFAFTLPSSARAGGLITDGATTEDNQTTGNRNDESLTQNRLDEAEQAIYILFSAIFAGHNTGVQGQNSADSQDSGDNSNDDESGLYELIHEPFSDDMAGGCNALPLSFLAPLFALFIVRFRRKR